MLTEHTAAPLILLVEDDPGHAAAIRRSFEDTTDNFRLVIVGTLHDARDAIERLHPAPALTVHRLPDGDGRDLARLANEAWPMILMTAKGSEEIAVQVLKSGAQDYVVKSAESFAHMPETVNHSLKAWSLVLARKEAEENLRCYARRLIEMEEALRQKIATELHDEIARDLTVLGMNLSIIGSSLPQDSSQNLQERIEDSARLLECISRNTRNIMAGLRPPVLDDYGLAAALRWHNELFSARTGIAVSLLADESFPRLRPEVELALFRISQEALMNTAKHADATTMTLSLGYEPDMVRLIIADNGKGFPLQSKLHPQGTGWGMTIMRERTELIGGRFTIESLPGQGTTVTVEIPLEEI